MNAPPNLPVHPNLPHLDVAARRAALDPERPAVLWRGSWLSYGELEARATQLAARLHHAGVGRGDRVAILAHNHLAHLLLILATPKLGFVYTPLNVRLAPPEQRALGAYLRPALLLHDAAHAEGAAAAAAGATADGGPAVERVALERFDAWLAEAPGPPPPPPALTPEDPQMILLTGGTSGRPKGAVQPYRQGLANVANTVLSWGLRDDDCAIQATPCFHAAVNAFTVPLLHLGARVALMERFEPGAYLDMMAAADATLLFMVPTMYQMLADHPDFPEADWRRVRWAISGGAPCPEPVREAFRACGVPFRQGYGLTEAGVNCFAISLAEAERHPASVGRPVLYAEAVVRRPDGTPCDAGEVGELTLAGPHLFGGYFERPDATAEVLREGWLWTGDLALRDVDGRFTIAGRRKEMFISGGENVFPVEIETVLYDHPAVAECAVLGVPDPRWGEVGLAAVVLRRARSASSDAPDAGAPDAEALRAFLAERLARFKVPRHLWLLDALPKSGAGKILKTELRRAFEARDPTEPPHAQG